MHHNPRTNLTEAHAAIAWNKGIASWNVIAESRMIFDLSLAEDVALVDSGGYREVPWYPPGFFRNESGKELSVGKLSAFSIEVKKFESRAFSPYDGSFEIVVDECIPFWIWPNSLVDGSVALETPAVVDDHLPMFGFLPSPVFTYEGSPIRPFLKIRPGMTESVTGTPLVELQITLRAAPQAVFGSQRIHIPSPYCAPPFCPVGTHRGTHIFTYSPVNKFPSNQRHYFKKNFYTKRIVSGIEVTPFDARIYGGPWKGSISGFTVDDTDGGVWKIQSLLYQDVAVNTPPTISYTGPIRSGYVSMHDDAGSVGLRFTQLNELVPCENQVTAIW
jgi:hypothetical protein